MSSTIIIRQSKQKEFIVYGKKRIIRDIRVNKQREFFAYYKNCEISVFIDEDNHLYCICTAPSGSYIVDGYFGEDHWSDKKKMAFGIKKCLENILYEEKGT